MSNSGPRHLTPAQICARGAESRAEDFSSSARDSSRMELHPASILSEDGATFGRANFLLQIRNCKMPAFSFVSGNSTWKNQSAVLLGHLATFDLFGLSAAIPSDLRPSIHSASLGRPQIRLVGCGHGEARRARHTRRCRGCPESRRQAPQARPVCKRIQMHAALLGSRPRRQPPRSSGMCPVYSHCSSGAAQEPASAPAFSISPLWRRHAGASVARMPAARGLFWSRRPALAGPGPWAGRAGDLGSPGPGGAGDGAGGRGAIAEAASHAKRWLTYHV